MLWDNLNEKEKNRLKENSELRSYYLFLKYIFEEREGERPKKLEMGGDPLG